MSAAGKVCTGFSLPYVAKYEYTGGAVSYTSVQKLARGVSVNIAPDDVGDDNVFYADNVAAETVRGVFSGGTTTLTVDGLFPAAEALIMGITAGTGGDLEYDDDQVIPYVGIGFVARYMSDGAESFSGIVLYKNSFNPIARNAATQEENIDWQTQELTAKTMRSDAAKHPWCYVSSDQLTEAAAEAIVKTKLGFTT